jgi:acyl carrier protein
MGMGPADVHPGFAFVGTRLKDSLAHVQLYMAIEQQLGIPCQAV